MMKWLIIGLLSVVVIVAGVVVVNSTLGPDVFEGTRVPVDLVVGERNIVVTNSHSPVNFDLKSGDFFLIEPECGSGKEIKAELDEKPPRNWLSRYYFTAKEEIVAECVYSTKIGHPFGAVVSDETFTLTRPPESDAIFLVVIRLIALLVAWCVGVFVISTD